MRPLKLTPILLMLVVIGTPFVIAPTHAQDTPKTVPFEVWDYVDYAAWSPDGNQFTFTTYSDQYTDPPTWYTYFVETGLVLTSNLYPIPVQLADVNKESIQMEGSALESGAVFISPGRQYLVYPSTSVVDDHYRLLGITHLPTGRYLILDVPINGMRVIWANDERSFIFERWTISATTIQFLFRNIDPTLTNVESEFLSQESFGISYAYDVSDNSELGLAETYSRSSQRQLTSWSLQNPTQNTNIPLQENSFDAQFSLTRPNTILAVIGGDLVEYDISGDPIEINRTPLGIPNIVSAYFSPDQRHLAIVSRKDPDPHDSIFIIHVLPLPPS